MPAIDVEKYLRPISPESPCGEDLEYDAAFAELGRVAMTTVERTVAGKVIPAVEPNWGDVFQQADELLARTRDLRVVILLINAGLRTEGMPALAAGLELVAALTRTFWKEVHPQLDADDGDPTLRLNSLLELEARPLFGSDKQPPSLLKNLDDAPLVSAKLAGVFSRRDWKLANDEIATPEGVEKPSLDLIAAAFREADVDELQATAAAVKRSLESLKGLTAYLRETVGAQRAPDFAVLRKELDAIDRLLGEQLALRGVGTDSGTEPDADGEAMPSSVAGGVGGGAIRNRDDVVRTLDRLCEYFSRHEPSSPVPLLLLRAKRLVAKDFLAILRDLTPDGVAQAEIVVGSSGAEEQE